MKTEMALNLKTFRTHYKNLRPYRILFEAIHSESLEVQVVYECLYRNDAGQIWVRPKAMFESDVEIDGIRRKRFQSYNSLEEIPQEALEQIQHPDFQVEENFPPAFTK